MQYVRTFFNILFYIDVGIIFLHFLMVLIEFAGYFFSDKDSKLKNFVPAFLTALWLFFRNAFVPLGLFFILLFLKIFFASKIIFSCLSVLIYIIFLAGAVGLIRMLLDYDRDDFPDMSEYCSKGAVLVGIIIVAIIAKVCLL